MILLGASRPTVHGKDGLRPIFVRHTEIFKLLDVAPGITIVAKCTLLHFTSWPRGAHRGVRQQHKDRGWGSRAPRLKLFSGSVRKFTCSIVSSSAQNRSPFSLFCQINTSLE